MDLPFHDPLYDREEEYIYQEEGEEEDENEEGEIGDILREFLKNDDRSIKSNEKKNQNDDIETKLMSKLMKRNILNDEEDYFEEDEEVEGDGDEDEEKEKEAENENENEKQKRRDGLSNVTSSQSNAPNLTHYHNDNYDYSPNLKVPQSQVEVEKSGRGLVRKGVFSKISEPEEASSFWISTTSNTSVVTINSLRHHLTDEVVHKYLTSLVSLDIRGSAMMLTTLPDAVGSLTRLTYLSVDDNSGFCRLPESIGRLTNLEILGAGVNQMSSLPESVKDLQNLRVLRLGACSLPTFPPQILSLSRLETLYLDHNAISSVPPAFPHCCPYVRSLHLHSNTPPLTSLPGSLIYLSRLQDLSISLSQASTAPLSLVLYSYAKGISLTTNRNIKQEEMSEEAHMYIHSSLIPLSAESFLGSLAVPSLKALAAKYVHLYQIHYSPGMIPLDCIDYLSSFFICDLCFTLSFDQPVIVRFGQAYQLVGDWLAPKISSALKRLTSRLAKLRKDNKELNELSSKQEGCFRSVNKPPQAIPVQDWSIYSFGYPNQPNTTTTNTTTMKTTAIPSGSPKLPKLSNNINKYYSPYEFMARSELGDKPSVISQTLSNNIADVICLCCANCALTWIREDPERLIRHEHTQNVDVMTEERIFREYMTYKSIKYQSNYI